LFKNAAPGVPAFLDISKIKITFFEKSSEILKGISKFQVSWISKTFYLFRNNLIILNNFNQSKFAYGKSSNYTESSEFSCLIISVSYYY